MMALKPPDEEEYGFNGDEYTKREAPLPIK